MWKANEYKDGCILSTLLNQALQPPSENACLGTSQRMPQIQPDTHARQRMTTQDTSSKMKWQMRICAAYYRIDRNEVWLKIYSGLFKIK